MGIKNDYRVSTIAILCKDCNQDVGLYPARHQCSSPKKLPTLYSSTSNSSWTQSPTSPIQEEQSYFDYTAPTPTTGRKLWGKVKENEKWKELVQAEKKVQQEKSSSKLWEKIINVTMSNNSLYDDCPESDDDDWEGETHVSRVLREYYETHRRPLPEWLLDDDMTKTIRKPSKRLWQQNEDSMSSRQKEIMEIRKSNSTTQITQTKHFSSEYESPTYTSSSSIQNTQTKHFSNEYHTTKSIENKHIRDTLRNSNSNSALHSHEEYNTIRSSHSMPNVNESFSRPKSERKPSNFANVTLSMNNSLRHLKANTSSKYQYVSSTAKSLF